MKSVVRQLKGGTDDASIQAAPFTIVGKHADGLESFVQHVALVAVECEVSANSEIPIWHSGPPINAASTESGSSEAMPKCRADLVLDVSLSADERNAMVHWKSKVEKEKRPPAAFQQYTVSPPVRWMKSETGRRLYRRFSCAGFVLSCYAAARIHILCDESRLPEVSLDEVQEAYPQLKRVVQASPEVRDKVGFVSLDELGLSGDGPWKIVLAGYIFHAFSGVDSPKKRPHAYEPSSSIEALFPTGDRAEN